MAEKSAKKQNNNNTTDFTRLLSVHDLFAM